ncbi:MAG TPA: twin-arginine translocase subunit TatC [Pirellulaceae bacterium]|nr:twin-arginine translocase subunit TatC [Pirellulaceae bacterium]
MMAERVPRQRAGYSRPNDDLFESTRMSFGEHLEELRRVLVRAVIGLAVGTAIGFFIATSVVEFLTRPLDRALRKYEQGLAVKRLAQDRGWLSPDLKRWLSEDSRAPQTVMVDPEQLLAAIEPYLEQSGASVSWQPMRFAQQLGPDAILRICRQLVAPSETGDQGARIRLITQALTEDDFAAVQRVASAMTPATQDVRLVAAALNRVCDRSELFNEEAFGDLLRDPHWFFNFMFGISKDRQLADLLDKHRQHPTPESQRGLNELLLAGTFAEEFSKMRKTMVPLEIWSELDVRPQSLAATDGFMIWMKAALIAGVFLSSPWVFYQLWSFVAAGLYPQEKRYVHIYLPVSLLLFLSGIGVAFFFVFDPVLTFLFSFNAKMGIALQPRINEWLSFVLFLPLGFGIAFQLPLVMLFLFRLGILSVQQYLSKWRIAVMVIFVIAMLLTPAEPISMILLAAPLTVLYFLGVGLCVWMPGARTAAEPT